MANTGAYPAPQARAEHRWLNTSEVMAQLLRAGMPSSRMTVVRAFASGAIPARRIGRLWYVRSDVLEDYIGLAPPDPQQGG